MMTRLLAWFCLVILSQPTLAQQVGSLDWASADAGLKTIRADAIRGHMRFLSDSLLQGRARDSHGR
jgi:hypothetical protein